MRFLLVTMTLLAMSLGAYADIEPKISYQGLLKDSNGGIVADGQYEVTFTLYDSPTEGNLVLEDTQAVEVVDGVFSTTIPAMLSDFNAPHWLGISIEEGEELTPRIEIVPVLYALNADKLDGLDSSTFLEGSADSDWIIDGENMYSGVIGKVGIGTQNPLCMLDVRYPTTGSPGYRGFHYGYDGSEGGAWIGSTSPSNAVFSAGTHYRVGGWWTAKSTSASAISMIAGGMDFYGDTSLTIGEDFHPTNRMRIDPDGCIGIATSNPRGLLDVNSGSTYLDALFVKSNGSVAKQGGLIHHQGSTYGWQTAAQGTGSETGGHLVFSYVDLADPSLVITPDVLKLKANGIAEVNGNIEVTGDLSVNDKISARSIGIGTDNGYIRIGQMCASDDAPCCPPNVTCGAEIPCSTYQMPFLEIYDSITESHAGFQGSEMCATVKNFRVPHPANDSEEIWYASLEGPEAGAYCRGTATLANGNAIVPLPDHFRHIAGESGITVQVTPLSAESCGLAVVAKSPDMIEVCELQNGTGNYKFDFFVTAVRVGYEDFEVIRSKEDPWAELEGRQSISRTPSE